MDIEDGGIGFTLRKVDRFQYPTIDHNAGGRFELQMLRFGQFSAFLHPLIKAGQGGTFTARFEFI